MKMAKDQGDGLRVFVDDEGQKILAVDFLEKAERQGLDRLANVFQRGSGRLAQRLLDEGLGNV